MENSNTNNIQKPISMVLKESKDIIVNAINSVNLHPSLLEMIMKDLYVEVKNQAEIMSQRESSEYERMSNELNFEKTE